MLIIAFPLPPGLLTRPCLQGLRRLCWVLNQFADRVAESGKLRLVFCHDISFIHDRIMVQIICARIDGPAGSGSFFDGEVEETVTVKGLSAKGREILDKTAYDFSTGSCRIGFGPRGAKFIAFERTAR